MKGYSSLTLTEPLPNILFAASTNDDDRALADLSPEDIKKLNAELEESETKKVPLKPTSDGVYTEDPDSSGAHPDLIRDPGDAGAEDIGESGMM